MANRPRQRGGGIQGIAAPFRRDEQAEAAVDDPSVIPQIELFTPPTENTTPQSLFQPGVNPDRFGVGIHRFYHTSQPHTILIYTDGACLDNGTPNARAGCAFHFRPAGRTVAGETSGITKFRLENAGPGGVVAPQTSNRAELRAVIAVLQFRVWYGEGHRHLVIASDSEYVCLGVTQWVRKWGREGWLTSAGRPVANRDLWEELLKELRQYQRQGMVVSFWRVPRGVNTIADAAAKMAAEEEAVEAYRKIMGVLV
ncbi:hypothetical protein AA313_de0208955 [Arthrobotrys entomopaga]|nr:hypothetical protein AA313_de0208955 [Arthrobotrys entomopaga]